METGISVSETQPNITWESNTLNLPFMTSFSTLLNLKELCEMIVSIDMRNYDTHTHL